MQKTLLFSLILVLFLAGCTSNSGLLVSNDFSCADVCESQPHPVSPYLVWDINGVFPDCNCSYSIIEPVLNQTEQPRFSAITINSLPSNASVYIDNVYIGRTPVYLSNISIGMHDLKLEKNTFSPLIQTIYVSAYNLTLNLDLLPLSQNITRLYFDFETDNTTCPSCYKPISWTTSGVGDECNSHCTQVYNTNNKEIINDTSGNVLLIADYHSIESAYAYYNFMQSTIGNVTFYMNLVYNEVYPQRETTLYYYKLSESEYNQPIILYFTPGNYGTNTFNLSYADMPEKSYSLNEWHKITVSFNAQDRTWDLFIDNELLSNDLLLISNGYLNRMRFETLANNLNGFSLYLDNITLSLLN